MATEAYSESILGAIITALSGITKAAGYSQDIQQVQRYDRRVLSSGPKPCIHVLKASEGKQLVGAGWDVTLTIDLDCYLYQDPADELSTDRRQAELQWDVEKALTAVSWASLNADLVGEEVVGFSIEGPDSPEDGVIISLTIFYRLAEFDMETPI